MKRSVLVLILFIGLSAFAQETEIPAKVLDAFKLKYPDAEEVEWKLKKDSYQAEFFDFYQTIVVYSSEGIWMRTITLVSEEDLPEMAYDFIDENYDISGILQIHMIEDSKQTISYKVMIMDESEKITLKFTEDGKQVK